MNSSVKQVDIRSVNRRFKVIDINSIYSKFKQVGGTVDTGPESRIRIPVRFITFTYSLGKSINAPLLPPAIG